MNTSRAKYTDPNLNESISLFSYVDIVVSKRFQSVIEIGNKRDEIFVIKIGNDVEKEMRKMTKLTKRKKSHFGFQRNDYDNTVKYSAAAAVTNILSQWKSRWHENQG